MRAARFGSGAGWSDSAAQQAEAPQLAGAGSAATREIVSTPSHYPLRRRALNLDRHVGQRGEAREPRTVVIGAMFLCRDHGDNRTEMARPKSPEMNIGNLIALAFDQSAQRFSHAVIGVHIQQDRPGVTDQAIGPA